MKLKKIITVTAGVACVVAMLTACTTTKTVTIGGHEYKTVKEDGIVYEYVDGELVSINGQPATKGSEETEDADIIESLQAEIESLKNQESETPMQTTIEETKEEPVTEAATTTEETTEAVTEAPTKSNPDVGSISDDWTEHMEFTMDGVKYEMPMSIHTLVDNGWETSDIDINSYMVNPGSTIIGSAEFKNSNYISGEGKYDNFTFDVGSVTTYGESAVPYIDGYSKTLDLDCMRLAGQPFAKYPDIRIVGNLGFGSTFDEAKAVLGEPSDTYRSAENGYTVYTWETPTGRLCKIDLTIYDDFGVGQIRLAFYD